MITPDWVKHAIFYQIFPDRFAKSELSLYKNINFEDWNSPPTYQGYKGGNLWGVIEKLDYLQDLGINAIYFTPIFQSTCNHRYHTHDYYQIDPILGGNEAFLALLENAHKRNIKIVLDGVFNHVGRGFFYFNDILENGPHSPWLNWFKVEAWPISAYDGDKPANYKGWANNRALPEFNHDNFDVKEYLMQVAEYWLKLGIDGWRLDVPFEIKTPGFWQEFRQRVKAINPEAYIVGEVWGNAQEWLDGTQFDGVMNYLFTEATMAFTAGDRVRMDLVEARAYNPYPALNASGYGDKIKSVLGLYDWQIQLTQLNLLDSHDTARFITIAQGDIPSVELATLLLFTFPGAPSIYYGDEVGLPGEHDPDCRRGFPNENDWNQEILNFHRQLISIRHQYPALRIGDYQVILTSGLVYVFSRSLESEKLIIAVNASIEEQTISLETTGNIIYGKAQLSNNNLHLPPRSGCIIIN
ncbi:MAG TPA: glycoside hydrolase family 13 protein [Allocoleopsis sp.]